jgi:hypothetical protein
MSRRIVSDMRAAESDKPDHYEFDPAVPTAYPLEGKPSLLGDMPVRLRAEGRNLVAYGFGDQRVEIPAGEIGTIQVCLVREKGGKFTWASSLTLLAKGGGGPLLWARGPWGTGLDEVRRSLGIPMLTYPVRSDRARYRMRSSLPSGTPVLRTRPRGWVARALIAFVVAVVMAALGALAGVGLSLLLPGAIGGIRDLIGIALAIAGGLGAIWLFFAMKSLLADGLQWLVASRRAKGPAPWDRFRRVETPSTVLGALVTVAVGCSIPVLAWWGPIIAASSISHGFGDAALVRQLRQDGATTTGTVINVPYYTTDSNGDEEEHDQANLQFTPAGGRQLLQVPDPAIAGWTWPMDTGDLVTIVYDPSDPQTAAVEGQITGSVWHGAPTGNIIGGCLAIVAEPFLIWIFIRRVTARRRKAARDFAENLA